MTSFDDILTGAIEPASFVALVAVGLVLIYRTTQVLNFAQGGMVLLGGYILAWMETHVHEFWLAAAAAVAASLVIGQLLYRLLMKRLLGQVPFVLVMVTILLGFLLQAITQIAFGTSSVSVAFPVGNGHVALPGNTVITDTTLVGAGIAVVLIGGMGAVARFTRFGLFMTSTHESPALASHFGVNVSRVSAVAWSLSMVTATAAAAVYGLNGSVDPTLSTVGLTAFPAVLLGGLDSIGGALLGALVLGIVTSVTNTYLNGTWVSLITYGILLVVLIMRPQGLFGRRDLVRV